MGDQRGEVDAAGGGESDRPGQVGLGHPAGDVERQLLAPGGCGREAGAVVVRDADEDDLTAGPDRRDGIGDRVVVTGDLEGDVDRTSRGSPPSAGSVAAPPTTNPCVAPISRAAATRWVSRSVATMTDAPLRRRSWTSSRPSGPQP